MNINSEEIRKILVINLGGIGDLLLCTPALKAIRKKFTQARISLAIVPRAYELVKDISYIDEVFLFDLEPGIKGGWNNLKTLAALRQRGFDLVVNMRTLVSGMSALKIKLLLKMIAPKIKAGRNTQGRGGFFDIQIDETDGGDKYEMDYDIAMAEALGTGAVQRNLNFDLSEECITRVRKFLGDNGVSPDSIIVGVNPGGKPAHRWPLENFVKAIEGINKHINCRFVITGKGRDRELVDKIMMQAGISIVNAVDRLSLKELGALIGICRLYISDDTGPMHIAAILKTPLVAIFGPGYLKRFDPRNISDRAVVLQAPTPCAPCNRVRCSDLSCLKKITPEEVIEESLGLLARSIREKSGLC